MGTLWPFRAGPPRYAAPLHPPRAVLLLLLVGLWLGLSLAPACALNLSLVSGWPKQTGAAIFSSPALGNLDPSYPGLEVVIGSEDGKVYAWHKDGTTVTNWPRTTGGAVDSSPALADLDGDGFLEVIVGSEDMKVYAWHANGTLVTGWPKLTGAGVVSSPAVVNLDPYYSGLEVVVGSEDGKVYAWHADGTPVAWWPAFTSTTAAVSSSPSSVDIDGCGFLEVFVGSENGKVYGWEANGSPVTPFSPRSTAYGASPSGALFSTTSLGDVNGDTVREVTIGCQNDLVFSWMLSGALASGWPKNTLGGVSSSPAEGDINGDGHLEVVVGSDLGRVYAWNGAGTPLTGSPYQVVGAVTGSPALADLDGDGKLEVVFASEGGGLYVRRYNGILAGSYVIAPGMGICSSPAIGDIDGDSHLEVVFGCDNGKVYVLRYSHLVYGAPYPWPQFHHDLGNTRVAALGYYLCCLPAHLPWLNYATTPVNWGGGLPAPMPVVLENLGPDTWTPADYHFASPEGLDRWGVASIPLAGTVAPGETCTFDLSPTFPPITTLYYEPVDPLLDRSAEAPATVAELPLDLALMQGDDLVPGGRVTEGIVISRFPDDQPDTAGGWARTQIEECAGRVPQIVGGYPDGTYGPSLAVTRDQIAVFMQRAMELPMGVYTGAFSDIPVGFWADDQIQSCVDAGIIGGYSDGTYRPALVVTRDAMAVFIARGLAGGDGAVPTGPSTATFSDVPTDYWAFKHVEYAVAQHVVGGYGDGTYRPANPVTRDQMAVFVYRAAIQPTGAAVVLAGPAVTAQDPETGGECGWASLATASVSTPGYAYVTFDAHRLSEGMAFGGDWQVQFELRPTSAPTAPATSTCALTAEDLASARETACISGYPYLTLSWKIPTTLVPDDYLLVVSVEDKRGDMQEVAHRHALTLTP